MTDDDRTSIVYDAKTGEVRVDAPVGHEFTSINIDSAAGISRVRPLIISMVLLTMMKTTISSRLRLAVHLALSPWALSRRQDWLKNLCLAILR